MKPEKRVAVSTFVMVAVMKGTAMIGIAGLYYLILCSTSYLFGL